MLRAFVIVLGAICLLGGAALFSLRNGAGVALIVFGLLCLVGTLYERVRYRRLDDRPPGPGFVRTGERFEDPSGDGPVEVWFNAQTGERRYVRLR